LSNEPLVCICIPNYNNEETLRETLDSLVNQSYSNLIIKVFDNASTDNSMKILREYESIYSNIQVFQNKVNLGGEGNFNKCIENMEGQYSAIYHSDDLYLEEMIKEEVYALENFDISAVFTNGYIIDDKSKRIGEYTVPNDLKEGNDSFIEVTFKKLLKSIIEHGNYLICPTVMSRTLLYKELIHSWNSTDYKTSADLDVWLRFAQYKNIGIIDKKLIKYRKSMNSLSFRRANISIELSDYFLVMDSYINNYSSLFSTEDLEVYAFEKFRNRVIIERNARRLKKKIEGNTIVFWDKNIFFKALTKRKNFKIFLAGMFYQTTKHIKTIQGVF